MNCIGFQTKLLIVYHLTLDGVVHAKTPINLSKMYRKTIYCTAFYPDSVEH